ncbi:effector binding domain-containing protein [Microscilla marina]|nr:effector binding domain-containing protein [Microscilla marina]
MNNESKPRLARLTAILTQLQSQQILTAREIAEKHQVSIRTVYRDIRTLEQSGVPIVAEEGKGYSLVQGYSLPPVMFTQAEANALITVEQLIAKQDHSLTSHYQSAITKIKSVLQQSQKEKTELLAQRIHIRDNDYLNQKSQYLVILQTAITQFNLIELHYCSMQNEVSQRVIEPFAVYSTQGNWLLIAFCRLRNAFRSFRLDHIQKLKVLPECFDPHNMTLPEYFEQCRQKYLTTPDIPLSPPAHTFAISDNKTLEKPMEKMKVEPFKVIGITVRTSNKNGQGLQDIGALWQRFIAEQLLNKIPNKLDNEVYSIYTEYEGDYTQPYTTLLGCKVSTLDHIPEGMTGKVFAGGQYQRFVAQGNLNQGVVGQEWNKIWGMDLPRAYTADFEIYGEKAQNPDSAEVDILIAID